MREWRWPAAMLTALGLVACNEASEVAKPAQGPAFFTPPKLPDTRPPGCGDRVLSGSEAACHGCRSASTSQGSR